MPGPAFYALTRLQTRFALRRKGHGFREINDLMGGATDDLIDVAATEAKVPMDKIGDGSILQAIIDFLKSPAGQALISALITLLIGMLEPAPND